MIEIIKVLMEYGMDFEYEHRGSNGENIRSFEIGLEISNQQGKVYFSCMSAPKEYEESESTYKFLASKVNQECIEATSSF